ncbi:MAG: helix-turn-helix transcriptional regulator [Phycisphaerales bacterium]|nr:MAG: helix-turn-helix transcriptional regulator [Phycisphaerales bacterium]
MKESTQQLHEERILGVLVLIQKNLDAEMPLNKLARAAHFSPYHFHRIFRGMVGESLKEHIRRLRLERAAPTARLQKEPPADRSGRPIVMEKTSSSVIATQIAITGYRFGWNGIIIINDNYVVTMREPQPYQHWRLRWKPTSLP